MLARERIEYFLDDGSFHELDLLARHRAHEAGLEERPYTDGVITGWGTVEGRKVFVFTQDFTVFGGALGEVFAEKIHKLMDLALKTGAPLVGLNDGAGARIQEGVVSLASYGGIFRRNVLSSGVIPQISVILGPCAGGRRVLAGDDRLHLHGARVVAHVHHRARRREDGDRRGGHARGARRRDEPRLEVGRGHVRRRRREGVPRRRPLPALVPAGEQPGAAAARRDRRRPRAALPRARHDLLPASPNLPYDMHKVIQAVRRRRRVLRVLPALGEVDPVRVRPGRRAHRRHRRQPADGARRRARHRVGRRRRPASCARATRSTSRSSRSSTCPASSPASTRSTAASSATAPSCSTPTARRRCRASRSSPARRTAARTW